MVRQIVRLRGRVQGVGFRQTVIAIAQRFSIAGSVRNRRFPPDLEIDVEGEIAEIDRFIGVVLATLPRGAQVESIERLSDIPRGVSGFKSDATR